MDDWELNQIEARFTFWNQLAPEVLKLVKECRQLKAENAMLKAVNRKKRPREEVAK